MEKPKTLTEFKLLKILFEKAGCSFFSLLPPALLACLGAFFEGVSMALLIPIAQGIITMNFELLSQRYVFLHKIMEYSPFALSGKTTFAFLIAIIFVATILKNLFQYFSLIWSDHYLTVFMARIRVLIFERYLTFGKKFFDENNLGHLADLNLGFTRHVRNILTSAGKETSGLLMLLAYVSVLFFLSWKLTLFSFILFPLMYYGVDWIVHKIRENAHRESAAHIELSRLVSGAIMGLSLIKAYNQEEIYNRKIGEFSKKTAELEDRVIRKQCFVPAIQEILTTFGSLILVTIGAFLFKNTGQIAHLLVFFIVLRRASYYLGSFDRLKSMLATAEGAMQEIVWVFEDEGKALIPDGTEVFTDLKQKIEIRGLFFSYKDEVEVLHNFSCYIEKGKTTAIVGKTGSGKTTLTQLLMRFYDCPSGTILLDDYDIKNFKIASLREAIAFVPQEPVLFNDTLKANLIFGLHPEPPAEDISVALRKARLEEYVKGLPRGLETVIGDRGVQLSGGEKQRVAIARVILKKAKILIFDEATSALDSKTEQQIQEAIEEIVLGRTSIVIAHRLTTIQHADKIIVLEDGRVAEMGTLKELLANKSHFFNYWNEQRTVHD